MSLVGGRDHTVGDIVTQLVDRPEILTEIRNEIRCALRLHQTDVMAYRQPVDVDGRLERMFEQIGFGLDEIDKAYTVETFHQGADQSYRETVVDGELTRGDGRLTLGETAFCEA